MGYDAILTHAHYTRESPGLRRVGSAAIRSGRAVSPGPVAERGRPHTGSERHRRASMVSRLASRGATRTQRSRPGGSEATPRSRRLGASRTGLAARRPGAWFPDGSLDPAPGGDRHRPAHRRTVPSRARLVPAPGAEVVRPASGAAVSRTQRGRGRGVEERGLAPRKKNARRWRAWLVFEDASGLSHHPVVRRTWAPRGHAPVLRHTGANWKRLSIAAALAFRWDGRRSRFYFQTRPGTYTDVALIGFLRTLKRHFRGAPVILLWDGLPAHRSARMTRYLVRQCRGLHIERLPASAPDLNPVDKWGATSRPGTSPISAPPTSWPCAVLCAGAVVAFAVSRRWPSASCVMPA